MRGAYLGATRVQMLSERLEMIGRSGTTDGASALVTQLEHELAEANLIVERELRRWTA